MVGLVYTRGHRFASARATKQSSCVNKTRLTKRLVLKQCNNLPWPSDTYQEYNKATLLTLVVALITMAKRVLGLGLVLLFLSRGTQVVGVACLFTQLLGLVGLLGHAQELVHLNQDQPTKSETNQVFEPPRPARARPSKTHQR